MPYHKTNEPGINFEFYYSPSGGNPDEFGVPVCEGKKCNLWTVIAENASDTACYLNFYDLASIDDFGPPAKWSMRCPANSTIMLDRGEFPLRWFKNGLVISATSGQDDGTPPAAPPTVTIHF